MDKVQLPVVSSQTSLTAAWAAMKANHRSGVVVTDPTGSSVVTASAIVLAMTKGKQDLREIDNKWPILLPPPVGPLSETKYLQSLEQVLDTEGKYFAVESGVVPQGHTLDVITRHEWLAARLGNGPADCYCTNPNLDEPHSYSSTEIPQNGQCHCGHEIVCH